MREKNVVSGSYLSQPERFAQMYNVAVFHGQRMIQPEKLRELDSSEKAILERWTALVDEVVSADGKKSKQEWMAQEGTRDIVKIYDDQAVLLICGIENQDEIHYAMPLRQLLYDGIRYHGQWMDLKRKHRENKDLPSRAEFLSGLAKTDRLIPVITLCVYWGSEPWTGPRNLHEMLDIPPELAHYKSRIGDYPLNLLEVCRIENLEAYSGELKALLGFVRYRKNKTALDSFIDGNQPLFRSMTMETARAISVLGDAKALGRCLKEKKVAVEDEDGEKEVIDMCDALEEMIQDGGMRGEQRGGIRTLIEDNLEEKIPEARILEKLQRRFQLSEQEAKDYLEQYRC